MAGYNVSALTDFVNEQNQEILRASIFESKTLELFKNNIQVGIKHSEALNLMDINPMIADDSTGSAVDTGGEVVFTQRILTVAPSCTRLFLDPKVLTNKWMNTKMTAGSADTDLVFETEIMDEITKKLAAKNETALWQGDTASGNPDLNRFDGYNKIIDSATGVTIVTAATFTVANAMTNIDALYAAIPTSILNKEDMGIFMSWDYFRYYTTALRAANLFHYGVDAVNGELVVPGTNVKIYALNGLNGSKRVHAGRIPNYRIGTDLLTDADNASAVYLDTIEKVKIKVAYKLGVQVARPNELIVLKIS
ncbi:hypothetical protein FNW52_12465 [Flavobacterium sp. ZT3R18]|uniref:hypothetical protein n=1 Tax=Flavobacterium sp. ZT3R18 TaxID=2594429 RepID=UPI00117A5A65|nr:hypothetical protein [Flavobacterium sp. ZT3R18]TRX34948.1 hypothetical protein FNW52_12465 [Flavobacterium sp. ZT3R18]